MAGSDCSGFFLSGVCVSRIPALLIMPVLYVLVLIALPFGLLAFCYEWATYKLKGRK